MRKSERWLDDVFTGKIDACLLQVCGEEGRVEVVLVNPCATPLRLDGVQLQVQPHQPSTAAAGVGVDSGSSQAAGAQQQQQRSVSVMLAAGSKPVKVVLSYVPSRPGLMAITGVQVGREASLAFVCEVCVRTTQGSPISETGVHVLAASYVAVLLLHLAPIPAV
jgi:hypothetical protein